MDIRDTSGHALTYIITYIRFTYLCMLYDIIITAVFSSLFSKIVPVAQAALGLLKEMGTYASREITIVLPTEPH